jgi:hypothetical protein
VWRGAARTFGGEGVAHPLLVDDVDEDAQAQTLRLLQPAHLLLRGCALVFLFPAPRSLVPSAMGVRSPE